MKPMRPSPGSENVSPTSGVPATITSDAHALMKPTAAPGASGRACAAPVNAIAKGTPAASPTIAATTTSVQNGSGSASTTAPRPPSTRLAATQREASIRRSSGPPAARVKKPSSSVSEPAIDAELFEWPCCSSSVTTQLPTITLKPNDIAWIAAKRYRRRSRRTPASSRSAACRAMRAAGGASVSSTAHTATTPIALRYGARKPVESASTGTAASASPGPSTEPPP